MLLLIIYVIDKKLSNTVATMEEIGKLKCLKTQCAQVNLVMTSKSTVMYQVMWGLKDLPT